MPVIDSWNEQDLTQIPVRNWAKKLEYEEQHQFRLPNGTSEWETLRIYSVNPQAHLIGVTMPVGLLAGYSPDAILVKAFEKNYKTPSKPGVVDKYGFEQKHGEPLELVSFQYECIFDRACEAEMNRYRHNSKNYESGRYVDYLKHGLTIVYPDDVVTEADRYLFLEDVAEDFHSYVQALKHGAKKQAARRRLGFYLAVESVFSINLRSLYHMGTQRSAKYSPNGKEAEPQIGSVVTQMIESVESFIPRFYPTLIEQIGKGYR